jgi:hypothetical protein
MKISKSLLPYLVIATVIVLASATMAWAKVSNVKELFYSAGVNDPSRVLMFQGHGGPTFMSLKDGNGYEANPYHPVVDGSKDGGVRSMAVMSFNKCSPECCPSTYTCDRGCVCLTEEQKKMFGSRGGNKSLKDNAEF